MVRSAASSSSSNQQQQGGVGSASFLPSFFLHNNKKNNNKHSFPSLPPHKDVEMLTPDVARSLALREALLQHEQE